ncbi:MAG: PAS domain-containing protein [bacterium]|nr:PAS domain-containing protein [bacterium]
MHTDWTDELMQDHARIERALIMIERQIERKDGYDAATVSALLEFLFEYGERYHNQKEEQFLFPLLGERGIPTHGGPIAVMLSEHEMEKNYLIRLIRETQQIKEKETAITEDYRNALVSYISLTKDHIWKENDILYPMGRRVLQKQDNSHLLASFENLLSTMPYQGKGFVERWETLLHTIEQSTGGPIDLLKTLDTNTLRAMLDVLPIELTFVDANDVVRYFNKVNDKKIFPRTLSVVGRSVQQCHPPHSVHIVNRILNEMKSGKRDAAHFWIPFGENREMFLYISYYAVRDEHGNYLGCVEMNQDVAPYRALQGESRTLNDLV